MIVFVLHWLAPAVFPPTSCLESGGSIQGDLWRCFCVEETLLHGPILPTRAPKLFTSWVFQSDGQSLWSFPSSSTHPVRNYTLYLHKTFISHNFFKMFYICRYFLYLHAAFVQCHFLFSWGRNDTKSGPRRETRLVPWELSRHLGWGLCSQGGPTGCAVTAGGAPKTL